MEITKDILTEIMKKHKGYELRKALNQLICPDKVLETSGVMLSGIHLTPDGSWRVLTFPQWVKVVDPDRGNSYCFDCDERGVFIKW